MLLIGLEYFYIHIFRLYTIYKFIKPYNHDFWVGFSLAHSLPLQRPEEIESRAAKVIQGVGSFHVKSCASESENEFDWWETWV